MNVGLVTSYIIGGIIMISIILMNISVSKSSNDLTITQMTRTKASEVTKLLSHDLQKMGYNRTTKTDPIIKIANAHKIQFLSNIDNSTNNSIETITWELTNNEITATKNPNDVVLRRTVDGDVTDIEVGVVGFNISYFDSYGKPLADTLTSPVTSPTKDNIKQIYVQIKLESPEKTYNRAGGEGRYILSIWEKRFSPPNLEEN